MIKSVIVSKSMLSKDFFTQVPGADSKKGVPRVRPLP